MNVRWGWDVIQNSSKSYQKVFLWTCCLSIENSPEINLQVFLGMSISEFPRNGLICRYFYLHAQHWRSRLHRNVRQVGPELLDPQLSATFWGDVSQIFHILAPSPSNEQWPFSPLFLLGGKRIPTLSSQNSMILEGHIEIGKGGRYCLECFFNYSQWWGHQAKGQTFRNTWAFCWIWEIWDLDGGWFPLSKTEKKHTPSLDLMENMNSYCGLSGVRWNSLSPTGSGVFPAVFSSCFFWIWWWSLKTTVFIMAGYRFFLSV